MSLNKCQERNNSDMSAKCECGMEMSRSRLVDRCEDSFDGGCSLLWHVPISGA